MLGIFDGGFENTLETESLNTKYHNKGTDDDREMEFRFGCPEIKDIY